MFDSSKDHTNRRQDKTFARETRERRQAGELRSCGSLVVTCGCGPSWRHDVQGLHQAREQAPCSGGVGCPDSQPRSGTGSGGALSRRRRDVSRDPPYRARCFASLMQLPINFLPAHCANRTNLWSNTFSLFRIMLRTDEALPRCWSARRRESSIRLRK